MVSYLEVEKLFYSASIIAPIRRRVPIPMPKIVGKEVPASGREAWVGVGVIVDFGVDVDLDVGVGVDVPLGQLQLVWVGQDGFRQKPE